MDPVAFNELLLKLNDMHAPAILAILGGLLILADYYFDTDVPAHIGYVSFGLCAFLLGPASFRESFLVGLLVWSLLLNVHFMLLREILERDIDASTEPSS